MNLAAVIVNWNGGDENLACLDSLEREGVAPGRTYFVDNASTDGSAERVAERFPNVVQIHSDRNLGYGDGNNLGIKRALEEGADVVFLVNNDLVLEPGALAILKRDLTSDAAIGVVGPRVLYKHNQSVVWAAGGKLTFRQNLTTLIGQGEADSARFQTDVDLDYVPGCAMLVRREVFERAGLLDGGYFAYHEDVDFCMAASAQGFRVRRVGSAAAYHTSSAATGGGYSARRKYMMGVNTIWFLRRHGTPGRWTRFFVYDVLSLPPLFLVGLVRGRGRAVLAKALGMFDGARGRRVTAEAIESGGRWLW